MFVVGIIMVLLAGLMLWLCTPMGHPLTRIAAGVGVVGLLLMVAA